MNNSKKSHGNNNSNENNEYLKNQKELDKSLDNINNNSKEIIKELNINEINKINTPQINNFESQAFSNIINVNNSTNTLISNKILLDMPINLEKNSEKSNEEGTDTLENKKSRSKNSLTIIKDTNSYTNLKKTKLEKLDEFIIKLNEEEEEIQKKENNFITNSNNNEDNDIPVSEMKLPTESDKEEKMDQIVESNLSMKENEKIIYNANKYDLNNINLKSSEFNKTENNLDKNLTGSIMFINSNIDRNMHIKNGNENYGFHLNNNSSYDNRFNFADFDIEPPNNDQDFLDNLEIIKVSLTSQRIKLKNEETDLINNNINNNTYNNNKNKNNNNSDNNSNNIINNNSDSNNFIINNCENSNTNNNIINNTTNNNSNNLNVEENEYENKKDNEDKFFKPLDKYENKFNLEQINPF